MANADKPFGFKFAYTLHGGPPKIGKYKNTAVAIYPGDAVHLDGSGRVNSITGDDAPNGVALNYVSSTADQAVYVYDDLVNTIFEVQCDEDDLADDTVIGNYYDVIQTTGDTSILRSKHELDSSDSTHDHLEVMGLVDRPDNAWGANAKVYVRFHVNDRVQIAAKTA